MAKKRKKIKSIFDSFEVGNKVSKREYEETIPKLRFDLINMQYDFKDSDFQVLVLLAGNNRKATNEVLDLLNEWMDARFLDTHVFLPPRGEELEYPAYWRYWRAMPPSGRIGIFIGGWIIKAMSERLLEKGTDELLELRIEHMKVLEKCLVDNGTELIKLWLHVPRDIARKSLKDAKKHPDREPYVRQRDWEIFEYYDDIIKHADHAITETSTTEAPWQIIESSNERYRNLSVANIILNTISEKIEESFKKKKPEPETPTHRRRARGALRRVNLKASIDHEEYRKRLGQLQAKLNRLVIRARDKFSTVLLFEGWDAAGKGGVIRRMTDAMFAEDYRVIPIAAPTDEEKSHHYLWRFWRHIPRDGNLVIFDRSWYGRVLVERVEDLLPRSIGKTPTMRLMTLKNSL